MRRGNMDIVIVGTGGDDRLRAVSGQTEFVFGDPFTEGSLLVPGAQSVLDRGRGGNDVIFGSDRSGDLWDPLYFGDAWELSGTGRGGDDRMLGGDAGESLLGDGETMSGRAQGGADLLRGGAGLDILIGDGEGMIGQSRGGADLLFGGADFDQLYGDGSIMLDRARGGHDVLYGEGDRDYLFGDASTLSGSSRGGDDSLFGGRGDDLVVGDGILDEQAVGGNDKLRGGLGNDEIHGDGDSFGPFDGPVASPELAVRGGDDHLWGDAGDDALLGDAGIARRRAVCGDDSLNGGSGDDQLWGDVGNVQAAIVRGNDRFVFTRGSDHDTINDFDDRAHGAQDVIDLARYQGIDGFADLRGFIRQEADGAVIDLGAAAGTGAGNDVVTLSGIRAGQLGAEDFLF